MKNFLLIWNTVLIINIIIGFIYLSKNWFSNQLYIRILWWKDIWLNWSIDYFLVRNIFWTILFKLQSQMSMSYILARCHELISIEWWESVSEDFNLSKIFSWLILKKYTKFISQTLSPTKIFKSTIVR